MFREHDRDRDDNQNQTDVLVFGRVSDAQAVKRGGEQQLICI